MAYPLKQRAEIAKRILAGELTYSEAHKKTGAAESTIQQWVKDCKAALTDPKPLAKKPPNAKAAELPTTAMVREDSFRDICIRLAKKTVLMLEAQAEECAKPDFIRADPSGVTGMADHVCHRADRLLSIFGAQDKPAGEDS